MCGVAARRWPLNVTCQASVGCADAPSGITAMPSNNVPGTQYWSRIGPSSMVNTAFAASYLARTDVLQSIVGGVLSDACELSLNGLVATHIRSFAWSGACVPSAELVATGRVIVAATTLAVGGKVARSGARYVREVSCPPATPTRRVS